MKLYQYIHSMLATRTFAAEIQYDKANFAKRNTTSNSQHFIYNNHRPFSYHILCGYGVQNRGAECRDRARNRRRRSCRHWLQLKSLVANQSLQNHLKHRPWRISYALHIRASKSASHIKCLGEMALDGGLFYFLFRYFSDVLMRNLLIDSPS